MSYPFHGLFYGFGTVMEAFVVEWGAPDRTRTLSEVETCFLRSVFTSEYAPWDA